MKHSGFAERSTYENPLSLKFDQLSLNLAYRLTHHIRYSFGVTRTIVHHVEKNKFRCFISK